MKKLILGLILIASAGLARGEIKVSNVEVFSGYPWKEVVVAYTITGTDANADAIRLVATDNSANKSYATETWSEVMLTEGRHIMRWNAAAENVKFSSSNVVFTVSVVNCSVQLWENGPYWAERNVGANKPEEYGYYFWWGDTVGYKRNAANDGWVSVKDGKSFSFGSGNCPTYGKSDSELQSLGYIDSTGNLTQAHDAATVHLGAPWRMPTEAEFAALLNNCDTTWTTLNGVYGRRITGRGAYSTKSIFLPAAGRGYGSDLYATGSHGDVWSSTPCSGSSSRAWTLDFISRSGFFGDNDYHRCYGQSVRPVRGFAQ